MTTRVTAVFISKLHLFEGQVETGRQRLQEVLHNPHSTYLQIHDVTVFRLGHRREATEQLSTAVFNVAEIDIVLLPAEPSEKPVVRLHSYVQKSDYLAFLTVSGYDVRGALHLSTTLDPLTFLARDARVFFPVTDATITHGSEPMELTDVPVVFVRRTAVSFLRIGERLPDW